TTDIDVNVNGLSRKLHECLIAFVADNLASHCIGGFKESMSFARPFCHTCMTDKVRTYSNFVEDFVLRTPMEHVKQCAEVDADQSDSSEFAINRNNVLNEVVRFSVITRLPHDIIHDMLQ
uniref:Uncharacterized protein n=1 Tax=Amphimedon queenslandica TaxID=400682 RepID=A0A1X7UF37_AMPQE